MLQNNVMECGNGESCSAATDPKGWSCCSDRDGRARCPANYPVMCAQENCAAGGTDYCCWSTAMCANLGGVRECPAGSATTTTTAAPLTTSAPGSCPWTTPTAQANVMQCNNGETCNGALHTWNCCNFGNRNGRARCPSNWPLMCAQANCAAGGTDYCCMTSCVSLGGLRQCPAAQQQSSALSNNNMMNSIELNNDIVGASIISFEDDGFQEAGSGVDTKSSILNALSSKKNGPSTTASSAVRFRDAFLSQSLVLVMALAGSLVMVNNY